MAEWLVLLRQGRLDEAQDAFDSRPNVPLTYEGRVQRAELLCLRGFHQEATGITAALWSDRLVPGAVKARAALVSASCLYDSGDFQSSLRESQRAWELAESSKDYLSAAIAVCQLIERRSLKAVLDEALPLVPEARRYAIRAGDAQVLAQVHLVFGRVEGRAGRFDRAWRHFQVGREVLASDSNLWLEAAIDLGEASILSLAGDYATAFQIARTARQKAIESGWAKGRAVAATNLANFCVLLGRPEEGERFLREIPVSFTEHPNYRTAIAETRAQAAICRGDLETAHRILSKSIAEDAPNLQWYTLFCHVTQAQIFNALSRWNESLECTDRGLRLTKEAQSHHAHMSLRLCEAHARMALGHEVQAKDLEIEMPNLTVELLAASKRAQANALAAAGNRERALAKQASGRRLLRHIGSAPTLARLGHEIGGNADDSENREIAPPNLDSAATLIDLAGHPHVLGREALAVIEGAGCADAVALVATGTGAPRVLDGRGWSEADAARALESPPEGVEVLPVGRYRDEAWHLVVRPKPAIDPYCTFAAIRKLLAAAVSLDQYRRDEKQRTALWPADALDGDPDSVWASEPMAEIVGVARRIAPTPLSVLLTGETGTGKEMLARAIHRASGRAAKPFLPFNCTAVPRDMLESQLFGYRKGAFTGADASFGGIIRAAAGGTLFLDEIADVSLDVQPKLLRFLETHEVHPLGEPHPVTVDVRVIAATNASLEKLVADGRFREDLFYRLNVVRLKLPPLRERREEIPPLVYHYLRRYADEQRKGRMTLRDETLEYLLLFSWPGNVRQLANEMQRIVAMAEPDATITPAMLSPDIQASRRTIPAPQGAEAEVRLTLDQPLPAAVQTLEQLMVRRALDRSHGRVEEASKMLGISRKGLFLKRRRLGLREAS